jgi:hypothetical protein
LEKNFGFLEKNLGYRYGWELSNELLHVTFGLIAEKLSGFEYFSPSLGMLSVAVNA